MKSNSQAITLATRHADCHSLRGNKQCKQAGEVGLLGGGGVRVGGVGGNDR